MANKFKLATLIIAFLPVDVFVIKNSRESRNSILSYYYTFYSF